MKQYLEILEKLLSDGQIRINRTDFTAIGDFCIQTRYNLQDGFPLLTTKKIHFKSVVHELLWFLSGSTNIKYLQDNNVRIWNEWANEDGELGLGAYGAMWRAFPGYDEETKRVYYVDQIKNVIHSIKNNPLSRRHIVNAWNPALVDKTNLPPCHTQFQLYVTNDKKLSCHLTQRSADVFLGVPFNIASYSLLTHMIAHVCGLDVGEFVHTLVDYHLYENHIELAKLQLTRQPKILPILAITRKVDDIDDFQFDDFKIIGYNPEPTIKAKVAV